MFTQTRRWERIARRRTALTCGVGIGMVQHLRGNLGFEREIFPEAPLAELLGSAVRGVAPLLAPGGIALGALVAAAATYRHLATRQRR